MKVAQTVSKESKRSVTDSGKSGRPEPLVQAQGLSQHALMQKALVEGIDDSQRMVAQRKQVEGYQNNKGGNFTLASKPNNTGLPDNLKSGIEALSGYSMDNVRVHYNSPKPAQLNALAYAQGADIHLAAGQEKHLPHEAWHVVQQAEGRVQATMQMKDGLPVNDDLRLEREANIMGAQAFLEPVQRVKVTDLNLGAMLPNVVQRCSFDNQYDDFDEADENLNNDAIDPILAKEYMRPRKNLKLGEFLQPALKEWRREKRKKKKIKQRLADEREHPFRRMLKEADMWQRTVDPLHGEIMCLLAMLKKLVDNFDDKKAKAGQKKMNLGKEAQNLWEEHRLIIIDVIYNFHMAEQHAKSNLQELNTNIDVSTIEELKVSIESMKKFADLAPRLRDGLKELYDKANKENIWLDNLIGTNSNQEESTDPDYPRVFIHKIVKKCPYFVNIPFDELNEKVATGSHGKSANNAYVHKKVAGGFAITFTYNAGNAYVIDWGPKAANSEKYSWGRGSEDYDSNAGIGNTNDYFQV